MYSGPKDHLHIRILHSGANAQDKGIHETMVCRIRMLSWPIGPVVHATFWVSRCAVLDIQQRHATVPQGAFAVWALGPFRRWGGLVYLKYSTPWFDSSFGGQGTC